MPKYLLCCWYTWWNLTFSMLPIQQHSRCLVWSCYLLSSNKLSPIISDACQCAKPAIMSHPIRVNKKSDVPFLLKHSDVQGHCWDSYRYWISVFGVLCSSLRSSYIDQSHEIKGWLLFHLKIFYMIMIKLNALINIWRLDNMGTIYRNSFRTTDFRV